MSSNRSLFARCTWPLLGSWPFSPHIRFKLRCFKLTASPPPPPFLNSLPHKLKHTRAHTHKHTHRSCRSLINDKLSGKWHLWWLQHFWRFFFFFSMSSVEKMQMRTLASERSTIVIQVTGVDAILQKKAHVSRNFVQNYKICKEGYCYSIIIAPISWSISSEALDLCCSSAWWMLLHLISAECCYLLSSIQPNLHQVAHQSGAQPCSLPILLVIFGQFHKELGI